MSQLGWGDSANTNSNISYDAETSKTAELFKSSKKLKQSLQKQKKQQQEELQSQQQVEVFSVSQVNKAIRETLEQKFAIFWIKAEISNFTNHSSGHFYFSLKDAKSQISAVMFRGHNARLKFRPENGMEVLVQAKISVYEPRGSYQLYCEYMEPVGAGALQLAFEQLKNKLKAEGHLEPSKKKPIPQMPQHIGIITSPTGAAIQDMINVLTRRYRQAEVTLIPALVQGAGAAPKIVEAILMAQKIKNLDVLIVGRGGGSIEDLWAFNEESVARAIIECSIPVISAVGHEIDFTIADFVADLRAPTPSAAAELVAKNALELSEKLRQFKARMVQAMRRQYSQYSQSLRLLSCRLIDPKKQFDDHRMRCDELVQRFHRALIGKLQLTEAHVGRIKGRLVNPRYVLEKLQQRNDFLHNRLNAAIRKQLESRQRSFRQQVTLLQSLSPLNVVSRGYSLVEKESVLITDSQQLRSGDFVEIRFASGSAKAEIVSLDNQTKSFSVFEEGN